MWLEMMFLDLDGGLRGYLFNKNLFYSVPCVIIFKKGNRAWETLQLYQLGFVSLKIWKWQNNIC